MESAEKEKNAIISGIEADALTEEQEIINEARKQAEEKEKYYEKKAETILEEARQEAQKQADTITKQAVSNVKLELKRSSMHAQQNVIEQVKKLVEQKFNSIIQEPGYKAAIGNWIVEAAIGLGDESAVINSSEKERALIDQNLINESAERVMKISGKKISLKLDDESPLKSVGVILTASNGRTAYNNQVKTRIARKENEIQKVIYNALFADSRKEAE